MMWKAKIVIMKYRWLARWAMFTKNTDAWFTLKELIRDKKEDLKDE